MAFEDFAIITLLGEIQIAFKLILLDGISCYVRVMSPAFNFLLCVPFQLRSLVDSICNKMFLMFIFPELRQEEKLEVNR